MATARSAINPEDGVASHKNTFIKSEHEDEETVLAQIPTEQDLKVSKAKRKKAKAFQRLRGLRAAPKVNDIQHTLFPPIQQGPHRKRRKKLQHEEKTLFSYNDDNFMLPEAFLPEAEGLSDDDQGTNDGQPYAVTKEDFDNFFVGYSFDETSTPADVHATSSDRHHEDQNQANHTCCGITGVGTPPKAYIEYQVPRASKALDKAVFGKECFTEPAVDLVGEDSQDGFVHPSRRAYLLACANDPLNVVSNAGVKPQRKTGANQEPLLPRKNRQGLQVRTAGDIGSIIKFAYEQANSHVIGESDHVRSASSKQNTMAPIKLEYSDPCLPMELFPEHLPYYDGAMAACYLQRPESQETDKANKTLY